MDQLLRDVSAEAKGQGWDEESLPVGNGINLSALHRRPSGVRKRFFVSTGVHGDEPAGPLAARALIKDDRLPADAECWVLPCINPTGFALNQRENQEGIDLNRDYRNPRSLEVQAQIRWLQDKGAFDCAVCLHEDWEAKGFYMYAVNPDKMPCVSSSILESVERAFPIDRSEEIEGFPAVNGIIHPLVDFEGRQEWPESLYLAKHHAALGYTLETSSDFPLNARVSALVEAVIAMMTAVSSVE
ncbi:M14 family metallocarboxypeptidase [Verrucomicrobia bacterium]|jgi:murein peptide amidase A|nr:M14 family metallocarboxypeptidase [Verrucomicrobiota bacterium]MDA7657080.1 M14 family metallocarboxypeptidase [Verrucomicrobiota bacterium]MDA7680329.1 M14 family metallocarboxypeptidase [bacterium]MDA7866379.1 M14 family metallocarboxypeptidase [Verrucomicrobiota bacterium]